MDIHFKLDWKTILKLIGGAIFGWLMRHLLDTWKVFAFIEKQYEEQEIKGKAIGILGTMVTVLDILIFLFLATIGYLILSWIFKKLFGKQERLKSNFKKLQADNTKTIDHITFKWTVGIINGRPIIQNLKPYCANHNATTPMTYDQPLEMYRCLSCSNTLTKPYIEAMGTYNNNYARYKAIIQGELENKWDNFNK